MNCIILTRVSSSDQDTARQEAELCEAAFLRGWNIVEICEETITGKTDRNERWSLDRAEELAQAGFIQKVLIHEVSRLSRMPSINHAFVERLEELKVSLYWHAQKMETLLESGRRCPAAGIMLAVLSEMAREETSTLSDRVKSGMAQAKITKGRVYGRRKGDSFSKEKFLSRYPSAVQALQKRPDLSVRELSKLADVAPKTAHRIKLALAA